MKLHTSLRHFGCLNKHHSSKLMRKRTLEFPEQRDTSLNREEAQNISLLSAWCLRTGKEYIVLSSPGRILWQSSKRSKRSFSRAAHQ